MVAITAVFFLATGCAYLKDRGNDLADIVHAKVMVGDGADISARAFLVGLGGGYSESHSAGFAYRGCGTFRSERLDAWVLLPVALIEYNLEPTSGTITKYGPQASVLWMDGFDFEPVFTIDTYENYMRVGVTFQIIAGFDLELRPIEMIDFALGLLTIDSCADDHANTEEHDKPPNDPTP